MNGRHPRDPAVVEPEFLRSPLGGIPALEQSAREHSKLPRLIYYKEESRDSLADKKPAAATPRRKKRRQEENLGEELPKKKKRPHHHRRRSQVLRELQNIRSPGNQEESTPGPASPVVEEEQRRPPLAKRLKELFGSDDTEASPEKKTVDAPATVSSFHPNSEVRPALRTEATFLPWVLTPLVQPPPRLTRPPAYLLAAADRRVNRPLSPSHLPPPTLLSTEGLIRYASQQTQTDPWTPEEKTTADKEC